MFLMRALRIRIGKFLVLCGYSVLLSITLHASDGPTWARHATPLDLSCSHPGQRIESPDRQWAVEVVCRTRKSSGPAYSLRVYERGRRTFDLPLEQRTQELLWAPDSKAFF